MKVKELIEFLSEYNPESEVILSKDSEGNSYSPLSEMGEFIYVPESTWSGEVHLKTLTAGDIASGCTEEDVWDGDDGMDAVVFWPTN